MSPTESALRASIAQDDAAFVADVMRKVAARPLGAEDVVLPADDAVRLVRIAQGTLCANDTEQNQGEGSPSPNHEEA